MNTPKLTTPTLSPQLVWLFAATTLAVTIGSIALAKAFGSGLGGVLGTFFGVFFALGTLFASIAGTIFGRKLRGEQVHWSVSMG